MFGFVFFSLFYPINLYIFEFFFSKKLKAKVASITSSCLVLFSVLDFNFDFTWNFAILKWNFITICPFFLPWWFAQTSGDERIGEFLFWRNFFIAPICEEFYYRILLPKINSNIWLLSISFSLAHAHPLMFTKNWPKAKIILSQCFISFCFGLVCNSIRLKMRTSLNNFWLLVTLSGIHGIANYCGVPLIELQKGKFLFYLQLIILSSSIYLIFRR